VAHKGVGGFRLRRLYSWTSRGRKACARFIAKRDRAALADLAIQFGHLSPHVTDACYGQPDSEYRRLIDEELAAQMQEVATELAGLDAAASYTNMDPTQLDTVRERATRCEACSTCATCSPPAFASSLAIGACVFTARRRVSVKGRGMARAPSGARPTYVASASTS